MVEHRGIQKKIDLGRGKAGTRVGQPWNIYRIQPGTGALNFTDIQNQIANSYKVLRRRLTDAKFIETGIQQGTLWYDLIGDMRPYFTGDVFIQNDPGWGTGETIVNFPTPEFNGFVLTFHGPVKKAIGARIDRMAKVYRPNSVPDSNNYWRSTIDNALPLVLNSSTGLFSLGSVGATPTLVPIGLMPHERTSGYSLFDTVPSMPKHTNWSCYVPPLPGQNANSYGFWFREGDRLVTQDGASYVVIHPHRQEVGTVGSQLIVEREVSTP